MISYNAPPVRTVHFLCRAAGFVLTMKYGGSRTHRPETQRSPAYQRVAQMSLDADPCHKKTSPEKQYCQHIPDEYHPLRTLYSALQ